MAFGGYSRGEALGLIIGTLAAIGVGVGFGALLLKKPEPGAAAQATAKDAQPNSEVRPLAAIVTNLGSPADTFVRLQAAIVIELNTPNSDALAAKVGDEIVAYLRTVPITEIQGPTGFQFLREELKDERFSSEEARSAIFLLQLLSLSKRFSLLALKEFGVRYEHKPKPSRHGPTWNGYSYFRLARRIGDHTGSRAANRL